MKILDRIRGFFAGTVSLSDPASGWMEQWSAGGLPTTSGISLSPEGALSLSFVWGCASAISEDIGKLPFGARRARADGGSDPAPQHPSHWLSHEEFNPILSAGAGISLLMQWEMLWGNAYAEILRDGSRRPAELWPIHPSRVTVRTRGRELWYEVRREPGSTDSDVVFPGDMIHVRGMGDAVEGYSVLRQAREAVGLTAAAESFGASFFGNDATMGVFLQTPAELKPERRKEFEKYVEETVQRKKFRFMVLPGGVTAERMMTPPEDIQFLDTRKFQGAEICRLFRMPLHKVGLLDNATFSNIEHQAIEYATDTLQPRVTRLERELTRKLVGMEARGSVFVKANMNALLRGDYATRTSGYRSLISSGVMTPNEAKILEDMNPSSEEGMDKHWMQGAMQPVEILVEGPPEPPPAPPPPAGDAPEDGEEDASDEVEALRPVFVDAALRCVRRERNALAQRRTRGSSDTLRVWVPKFYRGHRAYVESAFLPCFAAVGRGPNGAWSGWLDAWERSAGALVLSGGVPEESSAAEAMVSGAMGAMR